MIQMVTNAIKDVGNYKDSQDNTSTSKRVSHVENDHSNLRNLPNAVAIWLALKNEGIYTRDASKPNGEASNPDNTLKDASEINGSIHRLK